MTRIRMHSLKLIILWLHIPQSLGPAISQAFAQSVSSDRTTNTTVSGTTSFTITEGTLRNNDTLFHSFDTFSPGTAAVTFDLRSGQNVLDTSAVTTVISRVTGGATSFIDGQLSMVRSSSTPSPDLFLLNPYGILFGENARLSLPGSFLASTAQSISFKDKQTFSAVMPGSAPLLSISTPVGLQFGGGHHSTGITLQGTGHPLTTTNPTFAPYTSAGTNFGLSVAPGESLSLIGHQINLAGGGLSAPGGQIEVGSVVSGTVNLESSAADYRAVESFGRVDLSARSLIDASGTTTGNIRLRGRQVRISDGSLVFSQNQGLGAGSEVSIIATEELSLSGATPTVNAVSGVITETVNFGSAGTITARAPQIVVEEGATISSRSFGGGDSGRLDIAATEDARISGYIPVAPNVFSAVATTSFVTGDAGELLFSSPNLLVTEGGFLGSTTLGSGRGGDVIISADAVEVAGATPTAIASIIAATTAGRMGNSGNLELRTRTLTLRESGLISTSSIGIGNAGDIFVEATERIDISGGLPNVLTSTIASTVDGPPAGLKLLLGLSDTAQGSAGNVTVTTPLLTVSDESTVSVANFREGDAGTLTINADSVFLQDAALDAFTTTGNGGNISLNIRDGLLWSNDGQISAISGGTGNGGNITINSPVILGTENSDIVASAVTGNGGNINIATQGLFGFVARDQQTPGNDITASSQFGVSGRVSVNNLALRVEAGLTELSNEVSDPDTQVAQRCGASQENQFVASGRGGLPLSPAAELSVSYPWQDLRLVSDTVAEVVSEGAANIPTISEQDLLREASGWHLNDVNQIVLRAGSEAARYSSEPTGCLT